MSPEAEARRVTGKGSHAGLPLRAPGCGRGRRKKWARMRAANERTTRCSPSDALPRSRRGVGSSARLRSDAGRETGATRGRRIRRQGSDGGADGATHGITRRGTRYEEPVPPGIEFYRMSMSDLNVFYGPNAGYVLELYEQYCQ